MVNYASEEYQKIRRFALKYNHDGQTADRETERSANAVQMVVISIEHISAKDGQERYSIL